MITNRCTYGADFNCGNHGRETVADPYRKPGAVTRVTKFSADAQWRKHGTWRKDPKKRTTRLQRGLDACAHRRIVYDEPTVCIRKREP